MARYIVSLDRRATVTQPTETIIVYYDTTDYTAAWVGARTVCRMGTLFKDDPRCKNPANAREFFTSDGEKFQVNPAVYTVRKIFVEGTRKTGKQRMTNVGYDDILKILEGRGIKMTKKLDETLREVVGSSDGLRITSANARRLGLVEESDDEPGGVTE